MALVRWRRLLLRTFVSISQAMITSLQAALVLTGKKAATEQQVECRHPMAQQVRRGNPHGTGVYCKQCGLRLQWFPKNGTHALVTLSNPRTRLRDESSRVERTPPVPRRTGATSSSASSVPSPARPSELHPRFRQQEEEPPPEDFSLIQHLPVTVRSPPTDVDQFPRESTETNIAMDSQRVLCDCGLATLRWVSPDGRHFWKCPRIQGDQCVFSVWECKLHTLEPERWAWTSERLADVPDDFVMTFSQYPAAGA